MYYSRYLLALLFLSSTISAYPLSVELSNEQLTLKPHHKSELRFLVENRELKREELQHAFVKYSASRADSRYDFLSDNSLTIEEILEKHKLITDSSEEHSNEKHSNEKDNRELRFLVENRAMTNEELLRSFMKYRANNSSSKFAYFSDESMSTDEVISKALQPKESEGATLWNVVEQCYDELCRAILVATLPNRDVTKSIQPMKNGWVSDINCERCRILTKRLEELLKKYNFVSGV